MIDVTGIDKIAFVKAVYALSVPQGMGFLQATQGALSDANAKEIASRDRIDMDYVGGRSCKMHLTEKDGKLFLPDKWYDHTDEQYDQLLTQLGFSRKEKPDHGCSCNCEKCQPNSKNRDPNKFFGLK